MKSSEEEFEEGQFDIDDLLNEEVKEEEASFSEQLSNDSIEEDENLGKKSEEQEKETSVDMESESEKETGEPKKEEPQAENDDSLEKEKQHHDTVIYSDESSGVKFNNESEVFNVLLQTKAEFENYKKRTASARAESYQEGYMEAVNAFLPALDSFILAQSMISDKNVLMGIQFIEKGILDTLKKMGVEKVDCSGEFNPDFHCCIDTVEDADVPSGHIVKVATNGFTYRGKVLRYANVVIKK